jgi:hypothetical protein
MVFRQKLSVAYLVYQAVVLKSLVYQLCSWNDVGDIEQCLFTSSSVTPGLQSRKFYGDDIC